MRQLWVLLPLLLTLGAIPLIVTSAPSLAATTTDPERQTRDLPVVKKEILDSTRYNEDALDVVIKDNQFVVTVINSKLNKSLPQAREAQASIIVASIKKAIFSRPEFGSILGVHINYIARASGSSHTDTIDGIDYRKDPFGNFVLHIS